MWEGDALSGLKTQILSNLTAEVRVQLFGVDADKVLGSVSYKI